MTRRLCLVLVLLLLVLALGAARPQDSAAARGVQLGNIYVDPSSGTAEQFFTFSGSDFSPGSSIRVFFFAPDGALVRYAYNPITVADDGTFRLAVQPSQDLAIAPGREVTVQLGRWVADFVLADDTYLGQAFVVVP
jgi:hypothetical protein